MSHARWLAGLILEGLNASSRLDSFGRVHVARTHLGVSARQTSLPATTIGSVAKSSSESESVLCLANVTYC